MVNEVKQEHPSKIEELEGWQIEHNKAKANE